MKLSRELGYLKNGKLFSLWLLYFLALLYPGIQRYRALHSHIWDMGMYQHGLWNYSLEKILVFNHHFKPILSVYAFIYKIIPYGESLLLLQSLSISIAIFPLFAYARDALDRKKAYVVVFMFCLFSPVWLINLTNFHPDSLIIPLGLSALYFQKKDRTILFVASILLLAAVKEISFFVVSLIFLYGALKYKKGISHYLLSGVFLIFGFILVDFIMPAIDGHALMNIAGVSHLGSDMGGVIKGIAEDPLGAVGRFFNYWKIAYIIVLFGSFLFVPFLAPLSLLPAIPGIALSLLSDLWRVYSLAFHYPSTVVPFVFVAFIEGLATRRFLPKNVLSIVVGVFLLINVAHAGFFLFYKNDSYHYSRYLGSPRDNRNRAAIQKYIPSDPSVAVASSNLVNHARLANREHFLMFPAGVVKNQESLVSADYVVYDRKREYELFDFMQRRGPEVRSDALETLNRSEQALTTALEYFETLYEYDGFLILRRR